LVIDTSNARLTAFAMINWGTREIQTSHVLPTLQMTIVEEALEKGRTTDDGTINRWLIQLFSE
jgi:hypothetical protein